MDRRNAKFTHNFLLPLALPPSEQYMWVQNPLADSLDALAFLCEDGSAQAGFRLPLRVGEPVCVDPHSLHALPAPLPHETACDHGLLVGFSVPWIHRATEQQYAFLQSLQFRLDASRGGVRDTSSRSGEKVFAAVKQEELVTGFGPGLLESCVVEEGHQYLRDRSKNERGDGVAPMRSWRVDQMDLHRQGQDSNVQSSHSTGTTCYCGEVNPSA